ncbi:hypothetical protein BH09ACT9_BH09ACT9_02820 [soil metagenome]
MSKGSEWKPLIDAVIESGWQFRNSRHGIYVYPADSSRRPITLAGTPGDVRSVRNARAQLRRAGLINV